MLTELNQGRTDGRNNDQILWTTVRTGLTGGAIAFLVVAFFLMKRQTVPKAPQMPDSSIYFDALSIE